MITKERFVQNINLLRLAVFSGNEKEKPYKDIIWNLQKYFPRYEDGFCAIEFYCFGEDFGKDGLGNYREPEQLYNELINNLKIKKND